MKLLGILGSVIVYDMEIEQSVYSLNAQGINRGYPEMLGSGHSQMSLPEILPDSIRRARRDKHNGNMVSLSIWGCPRFSTPYNQATTFKGIEFRDNLIETKFLSLF